MAHWAYARPDLVRLLGASRQALAALLDGGDRAARDKAWLLVATLGHYVSPVSRFKLRPRPQRVRPAANFGEAYARVLARYKALARQRRAPADDLRRLKYYWRRALARFAAAKIDARLNARLIAHLERTKYAARTRARIHLAFRKIAAHVGVAFAPYRFRSTAPERFTRVFSDEELDAIKRECLRRRSPTVRMIYVAALTGARIAEVMALGPGDIGPDWIRFDKLRNYQTYRVRLNPDATQCRTVPVAPKIAAIARQAAGRQGGSWWSQWRRVLHGAGIERHVGVTALRHTWVVNALKRGVPLKGASLAAGYVNARETWKLYRRHVDAGPHAKALARLNR